MRHEMTLFPRPYASIASGQKTIELRLYDEKRQSIQIGDQIRFTNTEDASQTTLCEVVGLRMSLKTLENCMKNCRYCNVGILQKTWTMHIPTTC